MQLRERLHVRVVASAAVLALTMATAGCSGGSDGASKPEISSTDSSASGPSASTPSGRPTASTRETPATDGPQTQVSSQIIETPPEALDVKPPAPALMDDYKPGDPKESIVLQATVATVRVYETATSLEPITTLPNPLPSGTPLTFLVDGQTSTRYKVLLPIKPNGSTGWLDPVDVGIKKSHRYKITVALSAHTITVTNDGSQVMKEKIAVGKGATPTPNGRYYIKELLKPPNPNGDYGPYAYGLSGFSPVEQNFKGGDDTIGIHGTNQPELLGTDVSHGCIRMNNDAITTLTKILPLGTPVEVVA